MKVNQFIAIIITAFIALSIGYSIGLINYSNKMYDFNEEIKELTLFCEEPKSLLENCPECADKYYLVVESETFDFYVPYGSADIILGTIPENEKDCRINVCIEYKFELNDFREGIE